MNLYLREGMEEQYFDEAREDLASFEKNYEESEWFSDEDTDNFDEDE